MAKARELKFQVGVMDKQFEVMDPDNVLEFSIEELTLVHFLTEDSFLFPLKATFYRKVQLLDGCSFDEICSCFGETCDTIYLPPGKYEVEICDEFSAKYAPDGIFDASLILEPVSQQFVLAEQLNGNW